MKRMLWMICAAALLLGAWARAEEPPAFFPTPQNAEWKGAAAAPKSFVLKPGAGVSAATIREYEARLTEWGFKKDDAGIAFTLESIPDASCDAIIKEKPYQKKTILDYSEYQAYFLSVGDQAVAVKACGEDGFFYALMTFRNLYEDAAGGVTLHLADIEDYPVFPVRGIFEGAYGVWDLEGRLNVIDWMGTVKLNSFMYGPKGDPKIRRSWRAPYDDFELFGIKRMVERCRENHIQFGYVIAPPQGVEYGSDADLELLIGKLRPLQGLGVRYFVIAFDDTLGMMYYESDRQRFKNLGEAESYLTNRLYEALKKYDPEVILVLVPEIYAGVYEMDYTRSIVEKLNPDIYIGWTGSEIGAPSITAADMIEFIDFYKRMPSLGDNWGSLFPLLARNPDIRKYSTQFTMNPYNLFGEIPIPGVGGASEPAMAKIECASLAEFAWNPYRHDPDDVVSRLAQIHYKPEARDVFELLMFKDLYHFRAYYALDTGYMPPFERRWRALLNSDKYDEIKTTAAVDSESIRYIASNLNLASDGAYDPAIGASMAVRADVTGPYLNKIIAALTAIEDAAGARDAAALKKAADDFFDILTIKGEQK